MNREQLERLTVFALMKEREHLHEENWRSLVEYALFTTATPLTAGAISERIRSEFSFGQENARHVKKALRGLDEAGRIQKTSRGRPQVRNK